MVKPTLMNGWTVHMNIIDEQEYRLVILCSSLTTQFVSLSLGTLVSALLCSLSWCIHFVSILFPLVSVFLMLLSDFLLSYYIAAQTTTNDNLKQQQLKSKQLFGGGEHKKNCTYMCHNQLDDPLPYSYTNRIDS